MVMQYLIRGFSLLTYWRKRRKLGESMGMPGAMIKIAQI